VNDNHIDWGEGPWNTEEDHAVWVDPTTDLDCMINRGSSGALCGYVGVPPSHPLHGKQYDDVNVDVHGGLTYSRPCQEDGEICHVPQEGREAEIWWFGFDCAHSGDISPRMVADMRVLKERLRTEGKEKEAAVFDEKWDHVFKPTYKDWAYVQQECTDLARQLAEVAA
jgi:hypothetical protein